MPRTDVTQMSFAKLYPLLINKAVKKGRTREEVDQVTTWLTGYSVEDIARLEQSDTSYGDFFRNAPAMNPNRTLITGKVCGIQVDAIEEKEFDGTGLYPGPQRLHAGTGGRYHRRLQRHAGEAEKGARRGFCLHHSL